MGRALMQRLRQTRPMPSPVEEALVNVLLAGSWLNERSDRALDGVGITHAQYNVLRILRGALPGGLPRGEIACRLIDRAPDVTRLVDRLEARKLVERDRDPADARRSISRITRAGVALLGRATAALQEVQKEAARRLPTADFPELSRLCEALYGPDTDG
jgi:DNA-binding MarR family transcriptional regulator